jgi:hypothetical protein
MRMFQETKCVHCKHFVKNHKVEDKVAKHWCSKCNDEIVTTQDFPIPFTKIPAGCYYNNYFSQITNEPPENGLCNQVED